MLQNPDLLSHPTQKLAAIFLLYEMYKTDPIAVNPFASVFVHLLVSTENSSSIISILQRYKLPVFYKQAPMQSCIHQMLCFIKT